MPDETCPIPGTTPTATPDPTTGPTTPFWKDVLSKGTYGSSKRVVGVGSAIVLALLACALVEAISYQAHRHWNVDGSVVTAFTFVVGFIAAMATAMYHKQEGGDA